MIVAALGLPLFLAPALAPVLNIPLESVITRSMIIFGGGGLLWRFGLPRREWLRGVFGEHPWRGLTAALGISIACCSIYSAVLVWNGAEALRPEFFQPDRLGTALLTGLFISGIEEPVFRHVLLRRLAFGGRVGLGAVLSSAVYALAHYIHPVKIPIEGSPGLGDSLRVYGEMLANLLGPLHDPAPFVGLFLLGLLLCTVVRRLGLAWTIGIHTGLIYYVKGDSCVLYWNLGERDWLFGSEGYKYDGVLFWLTCSLFLIGLTMRPTRTPQTLAS